VANWTTGIRHSLAESLFFGHNTQIGGEVYKVSLNPILILSGLASAMGGAIKDSRYEGFKPMVFLRSLVIGLVLSLFFPFPNLLNIPMDAFWFFMGIGAERCIVECYKLVRAKKPAKFDFKEWG